MGTERMSCCGELTHVYADAGKRKHAPGCVHANALSMIVTTSQIEAAADAVQAIYGKSGRMRDAALLKALGVVVQVDS